MAKCKECGTNVGCPCRLKEGLCQVCIKKRNEIKKAKNVATKT